MQAAAAVLIVLTLSHQAVSQRCLLYFYSTFEAGAPMNNGLVNPNCETAFDYVIGQAPYPIPGASTIARFPILSFNYDDAYSALASYTYVAIDELRGDTQCGADGTTDCGAIIQQLAANGLGGRVIPWINISPGNTGVLAQYQSVLEACAAGMCRALAWETYGTSPSINTANRANIPSIVQTFTTWIQSEAPGSAPWSILAYGIANDGAGCPNNNPAGSTNCYLNDPANDFLAMEIFFGALHQYAPGFQGVAVYAPADVVGTSAYQVSSVCTHLNGFTNWW
jgi:hypothetical protein